MSTVELEPKRLPPEPPAYEACNIDRNDYLSAYGRVLFAERQAIKRVEGNSADKMAQDDMISARVVGYLFIEFWYRKGVLTNAPCLDIVRSLASPHRGDGDPCKAVFDIGNSYRDYFLRFVRTCTKIYPTPSAHPSHPSFDTTRDMIEEATKAEGKDYKTARRAVLARDGFRCVLTGTFDKLSFRTNSELARKAKASPNFTINTVATCHIVNKSTMLGFEPSGDDEGSSVVNETDYATEDIVRALLAQNGLGNLISLDSYCREYFNNLELWFETTDEPNRYLVCVTRPSHRYYILRSGHLNTDPLGDVYITFTRPHEGLEFPDPKLLALHAACARVAHMSGPAEAFDELESDVEET